MPRIGIDLVEIAEIAESLDRFGGRYLERILAEDERREGPTSAAHVARAFAAKEAVVKAIGLDASSVPLTAIAISGGAGSDWHVTLRGLAGELAREAGIVNIALSLSTTGRTVTAVAVATSDETRDDHGRPDQGSDWPVRQAGGRGIDAG